MSGDQKYTFRPAWWIRGGHLQTLWGKFFRPRVRLALRKERWDTPDGDFLDIHRLGASRGAPRLVLLHGLEGSIRSHYVGGFFAEAKRRGWAADLLIFRGCGREPNRNARFYHSGDTADLAFVLQKLRRENPESPVLLAGVSLGGNVLLKFLGEQGDGLSLQVRAAAAVSVPFDLEASCRHISRGFSRIYDRHFLKSLRSKALAKLELYPGLFDAAALRRARSIYEFDDAVTAPVHGFNDAHDYYSRSSSIRFLDGVRRPTLLLNAADDPFLPISVLRKTQLVAARNPCITVEVQPGGGHVGFVGGRFPWRPVYYAEWRVCEFLASAL